MSFLSNWRQYIPSGSNLYSWLATAVMTMATIGDLAFARSAIIPNWRTRDELTSQLVAAEQALAAAERSQAESPEQLREQLATAQAALDEAASLFLNETQAAEALNKLYQYADESGVRIASLQNQPGPEQEEKGVYDVSVFQLEAVGAIRNLIDFVSRIEEAKLKSYAIGNVSIAEGEGLHTLTMNVALYASPYSSGAGGRVPPDVLPTVTPANLAQLEESLAVAWASADWRQAINLIKQILAVDFAYDDMLEKLYTAYVNYGYQFLASGDAAGATTQFNLALEVKPGGEAALAGLQQAAATPPPTLSTEEQLTRRLDEAWAAENWPEVISIIEQILAINPANTDMAEKLYGAHVNYGHKLAAENRLEEAKEQFSLAWLSSLTAKKP